MREVSESADAPARLEADDTSFLPQETTHGGRRAVC